MCSDTMHEQKEEGLSMDFFESVYHGEPPWDIGRPQAEYDLSKGTSVFTELLSDCTLRPIPPTLD